MKLVILTKKMNGPSGLTLTHKNIELNLQPILKPASRTQQSLRFVYKFDLHGVAFLKSELQS